MLGALAKGLVTIVGSLPSMFMQDELDALKQYNSAYPDLRAVLGNPFRQQTAAGAGGARGGMQGMGPGGGTRAGAGAAGMRGGMQRRSQPQEEEEEEEEDDEEEEEEEPAPIPDRR